MAQLIGDGRSGYLRARSMSSLSSQGSGQRLITIGSAAHPLLRKRLGLTDGDIRRLRHSIEPSQWPHDAGVRDFRISFELAAAALENVLDADWVNESVFRRVPIKVKVPDPKNPEQLLTVELVPDSAFSLQLASGEIKGPYLEWDCDTEHRTKIIGRIRAYLRHVGTSRKTPVLWVVPTQKRAELLASWMQTEAQNLQTKASIFAITTADQVDEHRVLTAPIWQVVGVAGKRSLLPQPQAIATGVGAAVEEELVLEPASA